MIIAQFYTYLDILYGAVKTVPTVSVVAIYQLHYLMQQIEYVESTTTLFPVLGTCYCGLALLTFNKRHFRNTCPKPLKANKKGYLNTYVCSKLQLHIDFPASAPAAYRVTFAFKSRHILRSQTKYFVYPKCIVFVYPKWHPAQYCQIKKYNGLRKWKTLFVTIPRRNRFLNWIRTNVSILITNEKYNFRTSYPLTMYII